MAEGCHQGLQPYLEGMVSMMLPKLADARPMVRIITCWSLPRYSHWLLTGVEGVGRYSHRLLTGGEGVDE